jgi:hypothetical protein
MLGSRNTAYTTTGHFCRRPYRGAQCTELAVLIGRLHRLVRLPLCYCPHVTHFSLILVELPVLWLSRMHAALRGIFRPQTLVDIILEASNDGLH